MIHPQRPESRQAWAAVAATLIENSDRLPPTTLPIGCLAWNARAASKGYGVIYLPRIIRAEGWPSTAPAHRVACFLAHGLPPEPTSLARHRCHHPPCIEPTHLQWGTHRDNSNDSVTDGRFRTALSRQQVDEIRAVFASGTASQSELARRYRVTTATVHQIVTGRTWKWCLTDEQRAALHVPSTGLSATPAAPSITERLLRVAPPKPPDLDDDEYINRWILDTAAAVKLTTTEVVHMALTSARRTGWPVYVPEDIDADAVLALAAAEGISTSEAAERVARNGR